MIVKELTIMKPLLLIFSLVFSSFCFGQNAGSIIGIVLDGEAFNEPLTYANVSVEGTNLKSYSDADGLFHFDNLADGNYTLLVSFGGYETKELNVQVISSKQTNVSASLIARTLSLSDLASINHVEEGKASMVVGN